MLAYRPGFYSAGKSKCFALHTTRTCNSTSEVPPSNNWVEEDVRPLQFLFRMPLDCEQSLCFFLSSSSRGKTSRTRPARRTETFSCFSLPRFLCTGVRDVFPRLDELKRKIGTARSLTLEVLPSNNWVEENVWPLQFFIRMPWTTYYRDTLYYTI